MAAPTGFKIGTTTVEGAKEYSLSERITTGGVVADLTIVDADAPAQNTVTYSLVSDSTGGAAAVDAVYTVVRDEQTGLSQLIVKDNVTLNFENPDHLTRDLWIKATSGADSIVHKVTMKVTNINEAPTAIDFGINGDVTTSVIKTAADNTVIDYFRTHDVDANDTFTYTIVDANNSETAANSDAFKIDGNKLVVKSKAALDGFNGDQTLWIMSKDAGGAKVWQQITVKLPAANAAQTGFRIAAVDITNADNTDAAIDERTTAGGDVGLLTIIDPDSEAQSAFTYTLVASADANAAAKADDVYEIVRDAATGVSTLAVKAGVTLNFENAAHKSRELFVKVTDGTHTVIRKVTMKVQDVKEAPTAIDLGANGVVKTAIFKSSATDFEVASLRTADEDSTTFTYTIVKNAAGEALNAEHAVFKIDGGKIKVKSATELAKLTDGDQKLFIKSQDGDGNFKVQEITIKVGTNAAPSNVTLSKNTVAENSVVGTEVGTLAAVDPNFDLGDIVKLSLSNDAGGAFRLDGNKLVVAKSSLLDYEKAASLQVGVTATDKNGLSLTKTFTVNLTDVDNEIFAGTSGKDKIVGTAGNDVIKGGAGKDVLTGGKGKDLFVFDTPVKKGQFDQITDFNSKDDTLQFSLSALKSFKVKGFKKGKMNKKFFSLDKSKDKDDYVVYNKKKGFVYLDTDGMGAKKGIEILKLKPGTKLAADDFLFI